jgi:16S rRNA A1518/A1519 N6-dimethyltransferase RsmA/KsgA/DIM1 with predicted DNA glycosylase/AP lyase activity
LVTDPKVFSILEAGNFVPKPKVSAAFVLMPVKKTFFDPSVSFDDFNTVITHNFNSRNKRLAKNLRALVEDPLSLCEKLSLCPESRAEDLGVEDYCRLTKELKTLVKHSS